MAIPFDLYLLSGQSNNSGRGTAGPNPGPLAWQWYGSLKRANDPVGNANTGSAWPAFCTEHRRLHPERGVCVVPAAWGGSALLPGIVGANGDWSASGAWFGQAVSRLASARAQLTDLGIDHTFRGVIWSQGEQDAEAIQAGSVTAGDYATALAELRDRFLAANGGGMLYIAQTGARNPSGSETGYGAVRDAQRELAHADPERVRLVFDEARHFVAWGWMIDSVHYSQAGLNLMGTVAARNCV